MTATTTFADFDLRPALIESLTDLGYTDMTLVQAQTLPHLLAGNDVLARAKTGSGKTAAFALCLLHALDVATFQTQALVLCPTRELADQVAREIRRLARRMQNVKILTLCGGAPLGAQIASLGHSPHVIVATPGRLLKLLRKDLVNLTKTATLVLDEADRMLDMGFTDDLNAILKFVPKKRQTLLFSATYPDSIQAVSQRVQNNPVTVDVTDEEQPARIQQNWVTVTPDSRRRDLLRALRAWGGALNLVFCNTKADCAGVTDYLHEQGVAAVSLHGDLEQYERSEMLVRFANGSASVMVATDVAARGLDVKDLDAVFNFELPKHAEVYVHRIGRTGRAGKHGVAVSLVEQREEWRWKSIKLALPDAFAKHCNIPDARRRENPLRPTMVTLQINGGRKNKLRPGDLLGAITAQDAVPGSAVGAIDLLDSVGYVAVEHSYADKALQQLSSRPIKRRRYRARRRT